MRQPDNQTKKSRKVVRPDLDVYQRAFAAGMAVFRLSKAFLAEEKYSLTDQVRRSSRFVAVNIAEGWRKRRYAASFVNKLNDSEGEAAETHSWLQFAVECGYLQRDQTRALYVEYDEIIAMLLTMQNHPEHWTFTKRPV